MNYMSYDKFKTLMVETKRLLRDIEEISKILNCGVITTNTLGDDLIEAILSMLDEHFGITPEGENADILINYLTDDEELTTREIYELITQPQIEPKE